MPTGHIQSYCTYGPRYMHSPETLLFSQSCALLKNAQTLRSTHNIVSVSELVSAGTTALFSSGVPSRWSGQKPILQTSTKTALQRCSHSVLQGDTMPACEFIGFLNCTAAPASQQQGIFRNATSFAHSVLHVEVLRLGSSKCCTS